MSNIYGDDSDFEGSYLSRLNEMERIQKAKSTGIMWCLPTCFGVGLFMSFALEHWGWFFLFFAIAIGTYYLAPAAYLGNRT